MNAAIPILDLRRQYRTIASDVESAVRDVLESGIFINGPNVAAFESEFAAFLGTEHCVGLNSGTDALHLALRALDIGPGDEVVTSPFTFIATAEAIEMAGATPIFADIDARTYALDPSAVEAAITSRTKAILPVHLFGLPADMPALVSIARRYGLAVIEDCAQSAGASIDGKQTGTFGDVGCFSFFPSKNLGACGDGGMLATADADVARRVRALRAHGATKKYYHEERGVNSRLDELQAAILRVKLPRLPDWTVARRAIAATYDETMAGFLEIDLPVEPRGRTCVYHQYTVALDDRDVCREMLQEQGIGTMVYYPVPLHLQAVHSDMHLVEGTFPASESAARRVLSLPMFPELRRDEAVRVAETLIEVVERNAKAVFA